MPENQNTQRKARAQVHIPLQDLVAMGETWHKPCTFDHPHVSVTAYAVLVQDAEGTWKHTLTTYNGACSEAQHANFQNRRRLVQDPARERAALQKAGFTPAQPAKARKGRKGGAR